MRHHSSAFQTFIAPAKTRPQVWRFLLCTVFAVTVYMAFTVGLLEALYAAELGTVIPDQLERGTTRLSLALILFTFAGMVLGLLGSLFLFYRRGLGSLVGPFDKAWKDFFRAAGIFAIVSCLLGAPLLWMVGISPNQSLSSVLIFLPLIVLLVLLQTGAEELFFRGFVLQQMAARFKSPWIWLISPSIVFGLLHYDSAISPERAFGIMGSITLAGILLGDLTRRTGNIGAAYGWHFSNNLLIITGVGFNDYVNGFSWKVLNFGYADAPLYFFALDVLGSLLTWAILLKVFSREAVQDQCQS